MCDRADVTFNNYGDVEKWLDETGSSQKMQDFSGMVTTTWHGDGENA